MRDRIAVIDIATKKFKALSYKQYDENNLLQIVVTKNNEVVDIDTYITSAADNAYTLRVTVTEKLNIAISTELVKYDIIIWN